MPRVAYSEADREHIRQVLLTTALELMARQGIRHTTVEQVYQAAGISRTFFYTFFRAKEELILEAIYLQQPRVLDYARRLMDDPTHSWREGVRTFLHACCYGERNGIAVMSIEEQQLLFRRLSAERGQMFREKQFRLFAQLLECFGIRADEGRVALFINLSLAVMVVRRAIPESLPLLVPEAADAAAQVQIDAIVDCLEGMRAGESG